MSRNMEPASQGDVIRHLDAHGPALLCLRRGLESLSRVKEHRENVFAVKDA